jgi:hypothetical protein
VIDIERPRLRQLKEQVASVIPCDPEDARAQLHAMNLIELLGRYVNWADRFIAPRPRRVSTWEGFLRHGSGETHADAIWELAEKIEAGIDLKPFLSERVERFGYVRPKTSENATRRGIEWGDKDYALNAYEIHHLHLSAAIKRNGWSRRTRPLLYISFGRNDAFLLMAGDHNSFNDGKLAQALAEARVGTSLEFQGIVGPTQDWTARERNRLQRGGLATAISVGRHTVMGAMLSTAGTSPFHTMHGSRMMKAMADLDPKLDQSGFARDWFEQNSWQYPESPTYEWVLQYCDLYLVETSTQVGFPIVKWRR